MKNHIFIILAIAGLSGLWSCTSQTNQSSTASTAPAADNTLTSQEKSEGWALLFDGKSMENWHNYGLKTTGKSWVIADNSIHLDAKPDPNGGWQSPDGGDLITTEEYADFDFQYDWKIGACGNSGVYFHVLEAPEKYTYGWMTGPEMQVLDDSCHPDSKFPTHRAGDLYDFIACKQVTVKPAGQWNHARIIFKDGKLEQWLNDVKVVELQMFENGQPTKQWLDLIAASKFPKIPAPDFGLQTKGHLALQDHGFLVWFKNLKIKA